MTKLSNRLETLTNLAKGCKTVCDVGTDHGLLAINLVIKNNVEKVIASDLREKPLEKCKENVEKHNLNDKVEIVLSSGIDHLKTDVDLVIIAGMGGILISQLLKSENINFTKKLLLQPNSDVDLVRKTLKEISFKIVDEEMLLDKGIYYDFILCEKTNDCVELSEKELKYGPINLNKKSNVFVTYIKERINYLDNLLNTIPSTNKNYIELSKELEELIHIK